MVSHGEPADGTDRQTVRPDGLTPTRYITLSAIDAASVIKKETFIKYVKVFRFRCSQIGRPYVANLVVNMSHQDCL